MVLLKAFNEELGAGGGQGIGVVRPWSLVCNDAEMAGAVGETLKGMGVAPPEGVGVADEGENRIADEAWGDFYRTLLNTMARRPGGR